MIIEIHPRPVRTSSSWRGGYMAIHNDSVSGSISSSTLFPLPLVSVGIALHTITYIYLLTYHVVVNKKALHLIIIVSGMYYY